MDVRQWGENGIGSLINVKVFLFEWDTFVNL